MFFYKKSDTFALPMSCIAYNYIEELFRTNYEKLYFLAYDMVHDDEVSRDIVSESFLKVISKRENLQSTNIMGYLYVTVRNLCYDYNVKHEQIEKYKSYILATSSEEDADEWLERERRLQEIEQVLDTLPPKTQFVLEQCYYHGHTYREVSKMLDISESAVKKHIMKAFSALRTHFQVSKRK